MEVKIILFFYRFTYNNVQPPLLKYYSIIVQCNIDGHQNGRPWW